MSFFKKISILCAAVQSKKLLLRTTRSADQGPIVVLASTLPHYTPIVHLTEDLYRGRGGVSTLYSSESMEGDATVLKTPEGYCLNIPVNIKFLKAHPNLDWSLPIADRNARLDGRK
jgi:hypothetical protein